VRRLREVAELARREVPGADARQVDARLAAQHAEGELLLRHLKREDRDTSPAAERGIGRDVERERRLSHARPRRDDDQIRRL
jgi:hypothetical protein